MSKIKQAVFLVIALFLCNSLIFAQKNNYDIIPAPKSLKPSKGVFIFDNQTKIYFADGSNEQSLQAFDVLRERILNTTGLKLTETGVKPLSNAIICRVNKKIKNEEGYILNIASDKIEIEYTDTQGLFYATQTIRQLLPAALESKDEVSEIKLAVPCCKIEDAPMFGYRGMHLDVCRHFVPLQEVKDYIDQMALLKLNVFHWHLTEDQGWRIEIKKYPRLTEIGGFRERTLKGHLFSAPRQWDNTYTGGYYTQEEIKEVVAYAKERSVTVIPEIELPGHAMAALTAYPEYSCTGGPFEVQGTWGVFNDVYCTKEETFNFLEDILSEVVELFPSEYIHIGGDECPKVRWKHCASCQQRMKDEGLKDEHELQSYFIQRIQKFMATKNKRIIGWDEILEGGLAPDATVMSWRGIEGGVAAAKHGNDVIMTPYNYLYLDYYQSISPKDPLAIGGFLPISKVYSFDPYPTELTADEWKHILGVQANTWIEYLSTREQREFMIYPRLAALAELAWIQPELKDFNNFSKALPSLLERYDYAGLNYSNAFYSIQDKVVSDGQGGVKLELFCDAPQATIYYTTDGSEPTTSSEVYKSAIFLPKKEAIVRAISVKDGKVMYAPYEQLFVENKAAGKSYILSNDKDEKIQNHLAENLFNRKLGMDKLMERDDWFSYHENYLTIDIDLEKVTSVSEISVLSVDQEHRSIYSPETVEYQVSLDGNTFNTIGTLNYDQIKAADSKAVLSFDPIDVLKVRLKIKKVPEIPANKVIAGAFYPRLFIEEIIVK